MSSPAHRVSTWPPVTLALDIPAAGTPVGQLLFAHTLGLKCKEWDCSPGSPPEGQSGKRAHSGTEEGSISSRCPSLPIHPVASHSSKPPEPELINLPSSSVKAATDSNNWLTVEALGSTIDCDRDSVVEVTHWKVLLTLDPSQQLGTISHVQILRRQPSTLPRKCSGRKFGPLAASLRVASGQRPI